jgi:hypothetical protein
MARLIDEAVCLLAWRLDLCDVRAVRPDGRCDLLVRGSGAASGTPAARLSVRCPGDVRANLADMRGHSKLPSVGRRDWICCPFGQMTALPVLFLSLR